MIEVPLARLGDLPADPEPWDEGGKIPWDEPGFSERMLAEHLSQDHDLASRRLLLVESQVRFLESLLPRRPSRVLDLGCGPGLHAGRLASLGHECVGIDFSPASVNHAAREARARGLACEFRCEDMRAARFGTDYDLVSLLYGEVNVFRREDALHVLGKARSALRPDGVLVLEPHTAALVERGGRERRSWRFLTRGLFSPRPHLLLTEHFLREAETVATTRFVVVDAGTTTARVYTECVQGYSREGLIRLARDAGFSRARLIPGIAPEGEAAPPGFLGLLAHP